MRLGRQATVRTGRSVMSKIRVTGRTRWSTVVAVLLVAATATAGSVHALAGTSVAVAGYTGCLTTGGTAGGLISQVMPGSSPLKACAAQQIPIHMSGLTGITAGTGLTASGDGTTNPTLAIDPAYQLPQGCGSGQLAKSNGSNAWSCADDNNTTYSAGSGLDLSSANVFSVKPTYALPQSCSTDQSPVQLSGSGWGCATLTKSSQSCPSAQLVNGIDNGGAVTCAAPSAPGPDVWQYQNNTFQDTPQNHTTTVGTLSLPAGSFLVQVSGTAADDQDGNDAVGMSCFVDHSGPKVEIFLDTADHPNAPFALNGVVTLSAPADVHLWCFDPNGSDHVFEISMTALKVGTVH
jgi:hypothetical protein